MLHILRHRGQYEQAQELRTADSWVPPLHPPSFKRSVPCSSQLQTRRALEMKGKAISQEGTELTMDVLAVGTGHGQQQVTQQVCYNLYQK